MKQYIVGFTARRIESNEDFYYIYTEEQLEKYKEFFNEKCKTISEDEPFEVEPGFDDAELTLWDIRTSLNTAVEITDEVARAIEILSKFLPTKEDILDSIKDYIEEEGYLED